jgi:hypothetical protein
VNRLKDATSPYLLQHADNPVHWWEWSEEAFAEAKRRNVPVLLGVGYAACHWCQVIDSTLRMWLEKTKPQVRARVAKRDRPDPGRGPGCGPEAGRG